MQTVQRRVRWNEEKFAEVSAAQRSSGLSVQAYCVREGINLSSFYRWRNRCKLARAVKGRALAAPPRTEGEFIELATIPVGASLPGPCLILRFDLGGGMSLTVSR